jgi:hypothetical protein
VAAPHKHIQRASREVLAVARADSVAHQHLRDRVLALLWLTLAIDVLATLIVFVTEHGAQGTEIRNLWDAFLFTTGQLLTASSVAAPATSVGKVLEIFFDLYAITVVAALAGSFGAFFHRISEDRREAAKREAAAKARPAA